MDACEQAVGARLNEPSVRAVIETMMRALDLWSFQHKEIKSIVPQRDEDTQLEAERRVLANSEKLLAASMSAHELLYEGSASAETALVAALRTTKAISSLCM